MGKRNYFQLSLPIDPSTLHTSDILSTDLSYDCSKEVILFLNYKASYSFLFNNLKKKNHIQKAHFS